MAFKMTMWLLALMFVATMYNVVNAYGALGNVDVQGRFEQIGLIEYSNPHGFIIPEHKPAAPEEQLANLD